jgi:predicted transcriptional regulator
MSIKTQVVLDPESRLLLDELARPRGGNRSFVVREALRVYAAMEEELDALEQTPAFKRMMESSAADIRDGRLLSHRDAQELVRRKAK